ncbi:hypothetical protein BU24DRAFT_37843 [Aaosphaeria arxii CBS 175.79]|uniref:Uncharacterized protein n=1 Tax=Aaosphaeria arxii CBS 175.79 TaxID=1450172 RepID=A0A6A5Y963_9PLEO|nr:uncharacterized protein BU24DRAFT_37843 [Aaosphaeria arxii CBS 175.79]KAF2022125.1 hypothetical protein BU24DRAFT_37843 [Aaosphaeria arxii CBS 175.79]
MPSLSQRNQKRMSFPVQTLYILQSDSVLSLCYSILTPSKLSASYITLFALSSLYPNLLILCLYTYFTFTHVPSPHVLYLHKCLRPPVYILTLSIDMYFTSTLSLPPIYKLSSLEQNNSKQGLPDQTDVTYRPTLLPHLCVLSLPYTCTYTLLSLHTLRICLYPAFVQTVFLRTCTLTG